MPDKAFGANSAVPIRLTAMASAIGLVPASDMPSYGSDVVGTLSFPVIREGSNHATSSLPVILVYAQSPSIEISYREKSRIANSASRNLPSRGLTGVGALSVVPAYPEQSYMAGFFNE